MKSVAVVTVSVAVLFLGTSVLAGAQNGRSKDHEGGNPHHQEGNVREHEGGRPSPSRMAITSHMRPSIGINKFVNPTSQFRESLSIGRMADNCMR